MKLIASGDDHFDEHSRWLECLRVHDWIAEMVELEQPDLYVCPGDIYERASTPKERDAVARWLTRIAAVCPVVITKGNHDRRLDCALLARLLTEHPIYVEEAASVQYIAGAAIACVAWPERAQVMAASGETSAAGVDQVAGQALQNVLRGLGDQLAAHEGPRLLVGHFMVDGSVTSVGQPLIGQSMNVGLADLALARADITLMSHIHCPQQWEVEGAPVVYCGSSHRTAFGETEQKSIVVAEFGDDGRLAAWRRVPTPCAGMVLLESAWDGEHFDPSRCDLVAAEKVGAEVRFRYSVATDQREAAKAAAEEIRAELLDLGAASVKIEEQVTATGTARAPEVAEAKTLADKLLALWRARRNEPEADRATRLIGKASLLEENARAL